MKHTIRETTELMAWILTAVIFGMLVIPIAQPIIPPMAGGDVSLQWQVVAVIVGAILFGAVLVTYLIRKRLFKGPWVRSIFSLSVAFILTDLATWSGVVTNTTGRIFVYLIAFWGFLFVSTRIADKKAIPLNVRTSNIFILLTLGTVGASLAKTLTPLYALLLFSVVAVYDYIAVFKIGTMQEMAIGIISSGILPGLAVPKKAGKGKKKKSLYNFAFIGGGDIFFFVLVAGSFFLQDPGLGISIGTGMFLALTGLFVAGDKKKSYPALPYMYLGGAIGMFGYILTTVVWGAL
ncbi:hypothetical protein GOV11_00795 [Candidatus Woesearchaeota archaeon]|nr:hypothetical protein [Candidatus Woesearchaeota archaeon]